MDQRKTLSERTEREGTVYRVIFDSCMYFDFLALLDLQTLSPQLNMILFLINTVLKKNVLNSPRRKGENKMGVNISLYTVFIFSQPKITDI